MADGVLRGITLISCLHLSLARILLFWSVDSARRTQELIRANVQHVSDLGIEHDVILAHYRGSRKDWDHKWYKQHVQHSLSGVGYKFHFLQRAYKAGDWEKRYDYIWALDSDIDISRADVTEFLKVAKQIGASIVGPTFVQKKGSSLEEATLIRREGPSQQELASGPNKIQMPDPDCDYRRTDFVELTAPLLKSSVLKSILVDCSHCIHSKSDWGLDMMWCKYVSERSRDTGCALVDQTPVLHLDWELAPVGQDFYSAMHAVQAHYRRYWSEHKVLACKRHEAGLVENIAEDGSDVSQEENEEEEEPELTATQRSQKAVSNVSTQTQSGSSNSSWSQKAKTAQSEDADEEEPELTATERSQKETANVSVQSHSGPSNSSRAQKVTTVQSEDAASDDEEPELTATQRSQKAVSNVSTQTQSGSSNSSQAQKDSSPSSHEESAPMSEVLGEGHFQVKAYADDPSGSSDVNPGSVSRQDGVPEDLSDQRAAPEANMGSILPSGEVDWSADGTQADQETSVESPSSLIDAQGQVLVADASLGAFQEAERQLREDLRDLRQIQQEMQQLELSTRPSGRPQRRRLQASLLAQEERPVAQSAQITALAAEARGLAMEAVQEVQRSYGKMTLKQLRSVRQAALKSVQRAIAEQVQRLEHKGEKSVLKGKSKSREAVMSRRILELEAKLRRAQRLAFEDHEVEELKLRTMSNASSVNERLMVAWAEQIFALQAQLDWDQKRMRREMQEELELKNKLRQLQAK